MLRITEDTVKCKSTDLFRISGIEWVGMGGGGQYPPPRKVLMPPIQLLGLSRVAAALPWICGSKPLLALGTSSFVPSSNGPFFYHERCSVCKQAHVRIT